MQHPLEFLLCDREQLEHTKAHGDITEGSLPCRPLSVDSPSGAFYLPTNSCELFLLINILLLIAVELCHFILQLLCSLLERFERCFAEVGRLQEVPDIHQFVIDTIKNVFQLLHLFVEFLTSSIIRTEVVQSLLYLIDGSLYLLWREFLGVENDIVSLLLELVGGQFNLFLLTSDSVQLVITLFQFGIDALDLSSHIARCRQDATLTQLVTIRHQVSTSGAECIGRSPTIADGRDSTTRLFVLELV